MKEDTILAMKLIKKLNSDISLASLQLLADFNYVFKKDFHLFTRLIQI
jgi:hypothetical protein